MESLMEKALQMLNGLVDGGCEYPDAEFKVVWELDLRRFLGKNSRTKLA